jgi:hypothetical protein
MKYFVHFFTVIFLIIAVTACQKELNFDAVAGDGKAVGTLKSSSGVCMPGFIFGSFIKDSALKATDLIELYADISKTGTYVIKSDTVAGFYFSGAGSVTSTGINIIQLKAFGTPTNAGFNTFTFTFGTSVCKIDVNVNSSAPPPTAFTFICAGTTFGTGVYAVGSAVGAQHTVTLNVAVTSPGAWTINSDTVNGLFFSGSGTFATATNTQVTLTANGTPVAASPPPYNYRVASGGAVCSFAINVAAAPPAPNLDYVPQTSFSNWSTRLIGGTAADTTYIQVSTSSRTFNFKSYKIFEVKDMGVPTDSVYNRKNGGEYYQFIDGNLGILQNPINQEYLVLDSNKNINVPWTVNFGANVAMGFPLSNIRVDAEILGKGETQTVASVVYTNVIRVKYKYTATVLLVGDVPVAEEERWFARGIGVIKSSIMNLINPATIVNVTTRVQIF